MFQNTCILLGLADDTIISLGFNKFREFPHFFLESWGGGYANLYGCAELEELNSLF
jgi:hypothetical protein